MGIPGIPGWEVNAILRWEVSRSVEMFHLGDMSHPIICIYFNSFLPIQILSMSMLDECINLEIRIGDKLCNLICLHWSSIQNMKEFETFVKNLDLNLELIFTKNPYLTLVIGDFNSKSQNWNKGDNTTASGIKLEII